MNKRNVHIWKMCSGITVILFLILVIIGLLPYVVNVYEKQKALSGQKEQVEFMGDWKNQMEDLETKQRVLDERLGQMVVDLANDNEFSSIVEQLFEEARSTQVAIQRIKPTNDAIDGTYHSKEISLEITGGYHSIARFINQVEQHGLMIEVMNFDIEQSTSNEAQLIGTILLQITMLRS